MHLISRTQERNVLDAKIRGSNPQRFSDDRMYYGTFTDQIENLRMHGFEIENLRRHGFQIDNLCNQGFQIDNLDNHGFDTENLHIQGFS